MHGSHGVVIAPIRSPADLVHAAATPPCPSSRGLEKISVLLAALRWAAPRSTACRSRAGNRAQLSRPQCAPASCWLPVPSTRSTHKHAGRGVTQPTAASRHFLAPGHTHTHTRLTAPCPRLPGWAGTRKVKPVWILLEQETVSGSGNSWAVCKSAPRSRQITTPTPRHSVFYRPDALPAAHALVAYFTRWKPSEMQILVKMSSTWLLPLARYRLLRHFPLVIKNRSTAYKPETGAESRVLWWKF